MEVNLSPELQAKLANIAAENNSGAEEYVRQLVEHYLEHDAWFRKKSEDRAGTAGQRRVCHARRNWHTNRPNV